MTLVRVLAFSVVVLLAYTLFANILPQVQSDPPTDEAPVAADGLDMPAMIAWGERLFSGKGTCTLCHNDLGRAPDLLKLNLAETWADRLGNANYEGEAKGEEGAAAIEIYLRESMVDTSAYVVPGFGKKGTNDTVSPMPAVDAAPISLSEVEMNALIAFLQDRTGVDVTVPLPTGDDGEDVAGDDEDGEEEGPAESAQVALDKYTCSACHDVNDSGADAGPPLHSLGAKLGRDGIREAILDPNATIAEGFEADMMPDDFGDQMRVSELDMIIDYLMTLDAKGDAQ